MFDVANQVDTAQLHYRGELADRLQPVYRGPVRNRLNFEGAIARADASNGQAYGYAQVFRSGAIEAVDTALLHPFDNAWIASQPLEVILIDGLRDNLILAQALGVHLPIVVGISLLGVKGRILATPQRMLGHPDPFERDDLILPEVVVESFDVVPATFLRSTFDMIWNAGGWRQSIYYDDEGNRTDLPP
jgi:hypothetical protein